MRRSERVVLVVSIGDLCRGSVRRHRLHFGGKPKRDAQGRKLTLSGEPWQPGMAEHLKAYEFNVASRTSRILMNLEKRVARFRGDKQLLGLVLQGGAP